MTTDGITISSKEYGFTLIELLVSIMILSLIVTISYSALRLGSKSWQGTINIINENSTTRFAVQFIRKKIEQIYPIYWNSSVSRTLAFQGEADSVKFIAPAPQGRETNEYYEYYLVADKRDTNLSLLLYYEPHDPSNEQFVVSENSAYRQILDNLQTVNISYYGLQENTKKDWSNDWKDITKNYPSFMQINITSKKKQDTWLDILVELRSEINLKNLLF